MAYWQQNNAVRLKVEDLVGDSLATIAERMVELEDENEDLNRKVDALEEQIAAMEADDD